MSLINDALKRAKDAQEKAPATPVPNLPLRPAESSPATRHGVGLVLPVSLAIVALLTLFFVWQWARTMGPSPAPDLQVQARTPETVPPPPQPAPPPPPAASDAAATNAVVAEPPEQPPPLKLQGVGYSPTRPTAIINGKTLFVGERIRDFRLVAITPESATLVGAGQTNVLRLGH